MNPFPLINFQDGKFPGNGRFSVDFRELDRLILTCSESRQTILLLLNMQTVLPGMGEDALLDPLSELDNQISNLLSSLSVDWVEESRYQNQAYGPDWSSRIVNQDENSLVEMDLNRARSFIQHLVNLKATLEAFLNDTNFCKLIPPPALFDLDRGILSLMKFAIAATNSPNRPLLLPLDRVLSIVATTHIPEWAEEIFPAHSFLEDK